MDTTNTAWTRTLSPAIAEHEGASGVQFLAYGRDALAARVAVTDTTERCLDVQYYIWKPDHSGRLLAERLLSAADRGVRVRLLLDDIGGSASDAVLLALDSHANIEVRLFNPIANRFFRRLSLLFDFQRVNRRMHNKSFTADRAITVLGGRNVGDHYFSTGDDRQFADFDVVAAGPAAGEVAAMFDRYWVNPVSIPIQELTKKRSPAGELAAGRAHLAAEVKVLGDSTFADLATNAVGLAIRRREPGLHWASARLVADLPEKVEKDPADISTHLLPGLRDVVGGTRRELFIVSPYFVPGGKGMEFFRSLRARGVRVVVLSNSLAANDVTPVHAGYRRYRKALLLAGVELWEMKPDVSLRATADATPARKKSKKPAESALHAKVFTFDRSTLFVGSLNLTPRSSVLNTEMGLLVETPQLTRPAIESLEKSLVQDAYRLEFVPGPGPCKECGSIEWVSQEDGREVRYKREPLASFWRRLQVNIFSLLPLESQL